MYFSFFPILSAFTLLFLFISGFSPFNQIILVDSFFFSSLRVMLVSFLSQNSVVANNKLSVLSVSLKNSEGGML